MSKPIEIVNSKSTGPAYTKYWLGLICAGLIFSLYDQVTTYAGWSFEYIFSLLLIPFLIPKNSAPKFQYSVAIIGISLLVLNVFLQTHSFYYFGTVFLLLFFIQSYYRGLSREIYFLILIGSPVALYLINVFGFPIRLALTEMASTSMQIVGLPVEAKGNLIYWEGQEFIIESACAGVKMTSMGLGLCLVILFQARQKYLKRISILGVIGVLTLAFLGLLLSNVLRIILLVYFKSPEGSWSHETFGIVSLVMYGILPLLFVIPYIVKRFLPSQRLHESQSRPRDKNFWISASLGLVLLFLPNFYQPNLSPTRSEIQVSGFTHQQLSFDVTQLYSDDALVYVKPCSKFWGGDHNPVVCWRGSGYTFQKDRSVVQNGATIYQAELQKDEDILYTAWWFDNGSTRTANQWSWRWDAATGAAPYYLVNIACESQEELTKQIDNFMQPGFLLSNNQRNETSKDKLHTQKITSHENN